jgi:hypothetical protein
MIRRLRARLDTRATAGLLLGALAAVAVGCGSAALPAGDPSADVTDVTSTETCPATVMKTLGSVLHRVYREGIESERTASARHMIEHSKPLREAIENGDAAAARTAAKELLATGHMTNLMVMTGSRTLTSVGGPALAPLHGTIKDLSGTTIASYIVSVWADNGFADEANGIAEGSVALRAGGHSVGGTIELPAGPLSSEGTLTRNGTVFQYTSFPARTYPSGAVTVYLLKPLASAERLCGSTSEDTVVNTLTQVARLIYIGETGPRTLVQIKRVQRNTPLLQAVAKHEPLATEAAVKTLLHHHIVRLRVSSAGHLLSDVGGPFVLAPVTAPLMLNGRKIGSFVMSIQDDEGYLRLAGRLAGLDVLMYMNASGPHPRLVKNSLGPHPGAVPDSGSLTYRGESFRVFTLRAESFPAGLLKIRVLVPIPYS